MYSQQKTLIDQLIQLEKRNQLLLDSNRYQQMQLLQMIRQKNKYLAIYTNMWDTKFINSQSSLNEESLNESKDNLLRISSNSSLNIYQNNNRLRISRNGVKFSNMQATLDPQTILKRSKKSSVDSLVNEFKQVLCNEIQSNNLKTKSSRQIVYSLYE